MTRPPGQESVESVALHVAGGALAGKKTTQVATTTNVRFGIAILQFRICVFYISACHRIRRLTVKFTCWQSDHYNANTLKGQSQLDEKTK